MILNLSTREARALECELEHVQPSPDVDAVREKLARALGPPVPAVIPGQTTIDEALEAA